MCGVSEIWDHFTKPSEPAPPNIPIHSQHPDEITSARNKQLLRAKQTLENNIKVARAAILQEAEEIERTRREEQAATQNLLEIAQAYPRSPEISRRSYQAQEQLREIQHQYQQKYAAIRNKYEAALRHQPEQFHSVYRSEVAALKSGSATGTAQHETQRTFADPSPPPTIGPFSDSPPNAIPDETLYSVTGIAQGDTLNVRVGTGTGYDIVARLPNRFGGLRIVGSTVMNDTTEWVQIAFDNRVGWVVKHYLQAQ